MRPRLPRLHWAAILLVTIFSLYMNLTAVATTSINSPIQGDATDYLAYAFNIKAHGVYSREIPLLTEIAPEPDAVRAPGYTLMIMPFVDTVAGSLNLKPILYIQAALGAITVLFSILIFVKMMPFWASIVGGLLVAISPHLVNTSVYLLTESVFTFLLVSHVYSLVAAKENRNLWLYTLSGCLLAASWLVRPTTLLLPLFYILIFGMTAYKKQLSWRALACLVLPFFIAFSAWSVRNELATGSTSDHLLTVSFIQNGSYINMMYEDRPETYAYPYAYETKPIKTVPDAIMLHWDHFKAEPIRYISWTLIGKPAQFLAWSLPETIGGAFIYEPIDTPYFTNSFFRATYNISEALHMPLMLLAIMACVFFLIKGDRNNFALQISSIIVLYFLAFHAAGSPYPRYSIPIRPFCFGLALCMMLYLYDAAASSYPTLLRRKASK